MNQTEINSLTERLFKAVTLSPLEVLARYPKRELSPGAKVTRFAPSPTGFLHIGSLFAALVSERLAHQSGGVFFLRIEDTDKKREVAGSIDLLVQALKRFDLQIDEGCFGVLGEVGEYAPYKQSERKDLYHVFARELFIKGLAYPCFCTPEELDALRSSQEEQKIRPGYYGRFAKHRNLSVEAVVSLLNQGVPYVLRFRSAGIETNKIPFTDIFKGPVSVTENDQDVVLLKSDGLPTYHFAHVVDDYLMGTTDVLRGDEWLSSLPIHLQLFDAMGWPAPAFGHLAPILKSDNGNRRKLSKRKDPEALVDYYSEQGYPNQAVVEYLLNIANSAFEDWRKENPTLSCSEFTIKPERFNKSGALFDLLKLADISKNIIAGFTAEEVYSETLAWAKVYDQAFALVLESDPTYLLQIFTIERSVEKPRKDFACWSEVAPSIFYFFDDQFSAALNSETMTFPSLDKAVIKQVIDDYQKVYDPSLSQNEWFEALKDFAENQKFARDAKTYKQSPDQYHGHIGDVAMILRLALTLRSRTPDLYQIMQVLGQDRVEYRLKGTVAKLSS